MTRHAKMGTTMILQRRNMPSDTSRQYVHSTVTHAYLTLFSKDQPLKEWTETVREEYLMELLRCEGPGLAQCGQCQRCDAPVKTSFVCEDCFSPQILCQDCLVEAHTEHPLHRVKVCISFRWNIA